MLKVLLLFYEPAHSGQATHVLSLAQGLDRGKYHITVVPPASNRITIERLQETGVEVIPLPMRKVRNALTTLRLARLLRREKVDLLHVHSQEAGIFGRAAAKLAGVPAVVYTPQTIDIRQKRWQKLYFHAEKLLGRWTDIFISVNEHDRFRLIEGGIIPPEKVVTIYNGIDLGRFAVSVDAFAKRRELGIGPEEPVVLQIGRLSAQKGPLYFLEAGALISRQKPEARFILAGDGPLREDVERKARELGLSSRLSVLGWRDDVVELLAASDVVTLTSLWEGLPYTILEAMAMKKPVVASDVNGCREAVAEGETGFLVPPRKPEALAREVLKLLKDKELARRMGEKGWERVRERFSLEAMIRAVENLYDGLAKTH